ETTLAADETPDSRPGVSVLIFSMSSKELAKQVENRVGQCILTCPTTSVFNGMPEGEEFALTKNLRFFGDGWQISKVIRKKRYWRIPTMDGEFVGEETAKYKAAIGGGNILILAKNIQSALHISEIGVREINNLENVIAPFPGGVVRSGSKVGSKYQALVASTNDKFCPSLIGITEDSILTESVGCVLEIVIDGLSEEDIKIGMFKAMKKMIGEGRDKGLIGLSAGNYGGKLGPHHFHLREILINYELE
ncbi:formylmethanofuran--tetrahydromethanopterin N-formyltransferase, partial [Betaproteobacteria bacterium]|nr:formylmethanofuran--tetrahydromethanopterin N-formyltransferase [Betaproteobacteria bacterium]